MIVWILSKSQKRRSKRNYDSCQCFLFLRRDKIRTAKASTILILVSRVEFAEILMERMRIDNFLCLSSFSGFWAFEHCSQDVCENALSYETIITQVEFMAIACLTDCIINNAYSNPQCAQCWQGHPSAQELVWWIQVWQVLVSFAFY